ncbi:MAG TPA: phenylalanine--tRNA ligase subunit beta, partial [Flavobacteriales bacterium]|nr:phenylalanine--tRNA ligase subunit beta [Flavobacteriales bacterium]
MKVSYKWLQDYLPIKIDFSELPEILTNTGLEVAAVEKVETIPGGLEGLVVGEILDVKKHPDADRLTVCQVLSDIGEERSIVCGAPNVAVGQKVVLALPGTTLYPVKGDPFVINKGKIRGEVSEGMICAEDEIGIGESHEGIIVLNKTARVGMSVRDYYEVEDDYSIEIDLTPNRTDAISHFGVARDYLAVKNLYSGERNNLKIPDLSSFKKDNANLAIDVIVEDQEACPRYSGLTMTGINIEPSPDWLKQRLLTIGLNPINNV